MPFTVNLIGPSPWGFRISGGRDFKKAITVSKVNAGSKAETACLQPGDIVVEINGLNTGDMLNVEAQNKIKSCTTQLQLLVERPAPPTPGQTNGITEQLVGRFQEAVQVSRDENQNYREYTISSPASLSPGPYSPELPSSPDHKGGRITPTSKSLKLHSWPSEEKNIQSHRLSRPLSQEISSVDFRSNSVSSRTPTPPGRYSPHSPIEREVPISPRRRYLYIYTHICIEQKLLLLDLNRSISPSSFSTQAVRITDDRFRHPECYTCTECGLNLKMRGHFWVEDKMYCEKHARERYQGPGNNYRPIVSPHH
uniref:PDZ and LIM domain protein 2 n=1 Tax=Sinocyclocheilus grahami TaxID=75366 RepID=A0A672SWB0_SINGR